MLDWSDGSYEHTAETLIAATLRAVEVAEIAAGQRVLDLGCGTGNAALEAARRGARVSAIDPAERLLAVAKTRAARAGLEIEFAQGDACALAAADGSFDRVLSVFAVIFAPDAERAASEMLRVAAPGGRIVLTSWVPSGPIAQAGKLLFEALPRDPSASARAAPSWGDPAWLRELFERRGARVAIQRQTLCFEAESAEAWFAEQEANHPAWRFVRRALDEQPAVWESVRERTVAVLSRDNEAQDSLRVTSEYLIASVEAA